MSRDDAYIYDMMESAQAILGYMAGKTWVEFSKDALLQDAVVRRLEIIGEAAGRVSAETQKKYSYIPWMAMRGTRNRVIHGYDSVQLDIICDIVQDDFPGLISELKKIIPNS
jgi:uncharacterized protein with HEPN domain